MRLRSKSRFQDSELPPSGAVEPPPAAPKLHGQSRVPLKGASRACERFDGRLPSVPAWHDAHGVTTATSPRLLQDTGHDAAPSLKYPTEDPGRFGGSSLVHVNFLSRQLLSVCAPLSSNKSPRQLTLSRRLSVLLDVGDAVTRSRGRAVPWRACVNYLLDSLLREILASPNGRRSVRIWTGSNIKVRLTRCELIG